MRRNKKTYEADIVKITTEQMAAFDSSKSLSFSLQDYSQTIANVLVHPSKIPNYFRIRGTNIILPNIKKDQNLSIKDIAKNPIRLIIYEGNLAKVPASHEILENYDENISIEKIEMLKKTIKITKDMSEIFIKKNFSKKTKQRKRV